MSDDGATATLATPADWPEVAALRHRVFVLEQGVPAELEADAADADAVHALSRDDAGAVVATGRLLDRDGRAVIGRMAADPAVRGRGHGAAVLAALHDAALARGFVEVELHAQLTARGFYERAGYGCVGEVYEEAGIAHVTMRKDLRGTRSSDPRGRPGQVRGSGHRSPLDPPVPTPSAPPPVRPSPPVTSSIPPPLPGQPGATCEEQTHL